MARDDKAFDHVPFGTFKKGKYAALAAPQIGTPRVVETGDFRITEDDQQRDVD